MQGIQEQCGGGHKLPDGRYRATVGTLFEHQEVCRTGDLEALIRHANAMASCRSFDDVVNAFRAGRRLKGSPTGVGAGRRTVGRNR